ncbi:hypothetical protein PPSIR1_27298 [Plesiocystis pacifica SIR-1]|uniref:Beta-lactamase n=1 Tax=Plesiocystis pacifica SIR-1 TaxID=391625 RepID=A6G4M4_9BACT|nr:sel1 repeat family protein [Plesiocystis pacifica]EDM79144.1 hypothetical protein PPSIR1_27298 [Plesiocystis pacifica SIR-1]
MGSGCAPLELSAVPGYAAPREVRQAARQCERRPGRCLSRADGYREGGDYEAAAFVYLHACLANPAMSCWRVGWKHFIGDGAVHDIAFGLYYLGLACEGGNPSACTALGLWWEGDPNEDWRGWLEAGCAGHIELACEALEGAGD